ncbi:hypothetical protein [Streptomyces sp. NPDC059928]|uniref:hypothetical protein n=1 Tax=unclassified Streptomyces TaxID=2593676 RepID=UPI003654D279
MSQPSSDQPPGGAGGGAPHPPPAQPGYGIPPTRGYGPPPGDTYPQAQGGGFGSPGQPAVPQYAAAGSPFGAPRPPDNDKRRTVVVAICAATAVLIAAVVTGVMVLRHDGNGGDRADAKPSPSASAPSASPSGSLGSGGVKPTIAGWKVVVNPAHGTAFDIPPEWEVEAPTVFSGFSEHGNPDKALIGHTAPAFYKSQWCRLDADGDGKIDDFALASVGTKGADGAKSTDEVAEKSAPTWVYAAYTQPDKSVVKWDKPVKYTTKAGVEGSYVKSHSEGAKKPNKCTGDGQAIVFGFKNSKGDFVAWDFYGRTGVPGAVGDDVIMRILSTVRLSGTPTGQPQL